MRLKRYQMHRPCPFTLSSKKGWLTIKYGKPTTNTPITIIIKTIGLWIMPSAFFPKLCNSEKYIFFTFCLAEMRSG